MKAMTYLKRIQKEQECSLHQIEMLTKALHRENLLKEEQAVRFRPFYGDFELISATWFTELKSVPELYEYIGDIDKLVKRFGG